MEPFSSNIIGTYKKEADGIDFLDLRTGQAVATRLAKLCSPADDFLLFDCHEDGVITREGEQIASGPFRERNGVLRRMIVTGGRWVELGSAGWVVREWGREVGRVSPPSAMTAGTGRFWMGAGRFVVARGPEDTWTFDTVALQFAHVPNGKAFLPSAGGALRGRDVIVGKSGRRVQWRMLASGYEAEDTAESDGMIWRCRRPIPNQPCLQVVVAADGEARVLVRSEDRTSIDVQRADGSSVGVIRGLSSRTGLYVSEDGEVLFARSGAVPDLIDLLTLQPIRLGFGHEKAPRFEGVAGSRRFLSCDRARTVL